MVIRRATPFSRMRSPAYTRKSRKREMNYLKKWLPIKVAKFIMGNMSAFQAGKFDCRVFLKAAEPIQIRDNAIEACRRHILRELDSKIGSNNYYFAVTCYPHQALRENKISTGPQADRSSTGMQMAFGTIIGNAVVRYEDDPIFLIATTEGFIKHVKNILNTVLPKLPGKKKIEVKKISEE